MGTSIFRLQLNLRVQLQFDLIIRNSWHKTNKNCQSHFFFLQNSLFFPFSDLPTYAVLIHQVKNVSAKLTDKGAIGY